MAGRLRIAADSGEQAASRNTSCDAKSGNIEIDSRQAPAKLQTGGLCSREKLLRREEGDNFLEARITALESGFTVEPWPTIRRALSDFEIIFDSNVGRRTSN